MRLPSQLLQPARRRTAAGEEGWELKVLRFVEPQVWAQANAPTGRVYTVVARSFIIDSPAAWMEQL